MTPPIELPGPIPTASPVSVINMLRSAQQHHIMLSSMADQKSSFLMGASVVTLTLILGKSETSVALMCLALGALLSAIFAALALMPRSSRSKSKSQSLSFNPLFFGHFTDMGEEEYLKVMAKIIEEDRTVFEAMSRDMHQMGMVLRHKKFFYLSWGYRCFVVTLVITLVVAVWGLW
ncbi:hypothetical protein FEM03_01060 [Phragmitibacter flavus]|uniref:Pycsar effector protein domain-containing protein n=1 Tax=Phragmitibacter flavus TaxID=2576071 RepID=A0A5R8KL17_9BACT|nr:Pycsar system effector family protein [Phragmitibacter flavus]TLD72695.1 hypothetical protein FEM03_01060 [Phragmitibacter flavus]